RANILPMVGLASTVIAGFVGAALDYSRANSVKAAMQSAVDATGLMLSRDAPNMTPDERTQKATDFFKAEFNRTDVKNVQVTANLSSPQQGNFQLNITASGDVDTTVARVLGQDQMHVSTSSEILWGIKKLELALVLDNTGSMAQSGKIQALKTAAHNLLTTL